VGTEPRSNSDILISQSGWTKQNRINFKYRTCRKSWITVQNIYKLQILSKDQKRIMFGVYSKIRLNIKLFYEDRQKSTPPQQQQGPWKQGYSRKAQKSQAQESKELAQEESEIRVWVRTPLPS
jgi:hypothetical protein